MRCPYETTYDERNCQLSLPPVCVIIKGGEVCRAYGSTMIRVKDPKASLDFYENVLGMELIDKLVGIRLYFVLPGVPAPKGVSLGKARGRA